MPIEEIIARTITGIRPFNELPIDAEIWREAHDQHRLHRELHAAVLHRAGIVQGLEVIASTSRERTVIVAPGVAIDPTGQTVVVPEPVMFALEQRGQTFFTLSFLRTADARSAVSIAGAQQHYRVMEGRDVTATAELPQTPHLELARIYRTGADKAIKNAADPADPGNDEINLLNRRMASPYCYVDGTVGEVSYVPKTDPTAWKPNRAGLWGLMREGTAAGFHLGFLGPVNLRAALPEPAPILLYVAGKQAFQPLSDAEVEGLRKFLATGGVLFGEACDGSDDFGKSFSELAGKLGATLKKVDKGHPILRAHHVFSAPPQGASEKGVLACDDQAGVLFGTQNYGGAWQGDIGKPDAPDSRERIRQAQEFGLNIMAYAAARRRTMELSRLG